MEQSFNIFNDILQELIDLHERTRCGCGDPVCHKCRDDRKIEYNIAMGLRANDPLGDKERSQFETLKKIFFHSMPDKYPDTYFICGEGGGKDEDTLPEYIFVCPAYGAAWSMPYKKVSYETGE